MKIQLNRALLDQIFANAAPILQPQGEVVITLCKGNLYLILFLVRGVCTSVPQVPSQVILNHENDQINLGKKKKWIICRV